MNKPYRLQPIVDLQNRHTIAHELLAGKRCCPRWDVSQWRDWYGWLGHQLPHLLDQVTGPIFVNVSSDQVADPAILAVLQSWTPHTDRVLLEWTEHPPMTTDLDSVTCTLLSLQDQGFQFAIDDIGSPVGMDGLWRTATIRPSFCKNRRPVLPVCQSNQHARFSLSAPGLHRRADHRGMDREPRGHAACQTMGR